MGRGDAGQRRKVVEMRVDGAEDSLEQLTRIRLALDPPNELVRGRLQESVGGVRPTTCDDAGRAHCADLDAESVPRDVSYDVVLRRR
jgi:hypothetical protein